jgi:DNA-binding MarR family transcriptional regulator
MVDEVDINAEAGREALLDAIVGSVRALNDTMQQHTDATSRHLEMTTSEVRTLSLVARRSAVTPTELGARLGVTSGGMTGIVDRLERAGHLRRREDATDRRKVRVEVTEEAGAVARSALGGLNRTLRQLLATRSPEELQTIADFLTELEAAIADHARELSQLPILGTEDRPGHELAPAQPESSALIPTV